MADKMTDRASIPDVTARIRGAGESGVKRSMEDIYHAEEIDASHSEPYYKGDRLKGGGLGFLDELMDNPDQVSPEDRRVVAEYLQETHPDLVDDEGNFAMEGVLEEVPEFANEFMKWMKNEDEGESHDFDKHREKKERTRTSEENAFPLSLKPEAMNAGEAPENIREFYFAWTGRGQREITEVKVVQDRYGISSFELTVKQGKAESDVKVKTVDIVRWFDGAGNGMDNGVITGMTLTNGKGQEKDLKPGMSKDNIKKRVGDISIDGIRLPRSAKVEIVERGKFRSPEKPAKKARKEKKIQTKVESKVKETAENTDKHAPFELTVDEDTLTKKDDGEGRAFIEAFGDDVAEFALVTKRQQGVEEISSLRITLKDGSIKRLSSIVFRGLFPRVKAFKGGVGFILEDTNGKKKMIFPGSEAGFAETNKRNGDDDSVEKVIKRMSINGQRINPDADVVITAESSREVTEERGPYTGEQYPQNRVNPHPGADTI